MNIRSNYYYIRLTAFFQDNMGKPAPERQTILDFTGARDDGMAVASAGPIYISFAPRSRQITTPVPHDSFYRPDALPATQPTASKHCKKQVRNINCH